MQVVKRTYVAPENLASNLARKQLVFCQRIFLSDDRQQRRLLVSIAIKRRRRLWISLERRISISKREGKRDEARKDERRNFAHVDFRRYEGIALAKSISGRARIINLDPTSSISREIKFRHGRVRLASSIMQCNSLPRLRGTGRNARARLSPSRERHLE